MMGGIHSIQNSANADGTIKTHSSGSLSMYLNAATSTSGIKSKSSRSCHVECGSWAGVCPGELTEATLTDRSSVRQRFYLSWADT